MFGSSIKQLRGGDITNSASIPPLQTGSPVLDLMKKNAVDLVKSQGEAESVPIRTSAYAQLVVSSTDRYPNYVAQLLEPTTSSNWILQRPNYVLQGYFYRIGITSMQIQWNLNTICSSGAPGISIGNDILPYEIAFTTTTTSQTIDPTAGNVTLTVSAGLLFIPGKAVTVVSGGSSFSGVVLSYSGTTLIITTITNIVGTYPATATWIVSSANIYETLIVSGFWSPTQLAANIQANIAISLGISVVTVTYGLTSDAYALTGNTGNFKFACAAGYKIQFLPSASAGSSNTTQNRTLNTLGANYINCSVSAAIQQFSPPTMSYTRWIDVCSSTLTKFQRVKDATTLPADAHTATIARVYLTPGNQSQSSAFGAGVQAGLPFTFTVDFATPKWCRWSPQEVLSNFDIQIRDEFGALLYWTPNCGIEYQFTLLASET